MLLEDNLIMSLCSAGRSLSAERSKVMFYQNPFSKNNYPDSWSNKDSYCVHRPVFKLCAIRRNCILTGIKRYFNSLGALRSCISFFCCSWIFRGSSSLMHKNVTDKALPGIGVSVKLAKKYVGFFPFINEKWLEEAVNLVRGNAR